MCNSGYCSTFYFLARNVKPIEAQLVKMASSPLYYTLWALLYEGTVYGVGGEEGGVHSFKYRKCSWKANYKILSET